MVWLLVLLRILGLWRSGEVGGVLVVIDQRRASVILRIEVEAAGRSLVLVIALVLSLVRMQILLRQVLVKVSRDCLGAPRLRR